MTKIPSRKACGTYGHGPLKICLGKEKDDDHDQDSLNKGLLHVYGHGPLINIFQVMFGQVLDQCGLDYACLGNHEFDLGFDDINANLSELLFCKVPVPIDSFPKQSLVLRAQAPRRSQESMARCPPLPT